MNDSLSQSVAHVLPSIDSTDNMVHLLLTDKFFATVITAAIDSGQLNYKVTPDQVNLIYAYSRYLCMYTCIHIHSHIYMYIYVYTYIVLYTYACIVFFLLRTYHVYYSDLSLQYLKNISAKHYLVTYCYANLVMSIFFSCSRKQILNLPRSKI